jgi:hypothetical protein
MKAFYPLILFLITIISVHAKTPQSIVTQTEVFIWGTIFFSISLGSLLLIVHLFPKSNTYKSQFIQEEPSQPESEFSEVEEEPVIDTLSTNKVNNSSTFTSITSMDSVSNIPLIKTPENVLQSNLDKQSPQKLQPPINCITINFDSVYKMRLLDVENICKEFIEKLNSITKTRSTSIYFIKNNLFVCYLEKKMNSFIEYDVTKEKIDLSQDIVSFLYKKLGAFSSTHSDAVLPLISNQELFGAIKIQFFNPIKNNEVNLIWKEIKHFSGLFYETYFSSPPIEQEESQTFSTSDFQKTLLKYFPNTGNSSLILLKIFKTKVATTIEFRVSAALRKILKNNIDIYKLNDDTYSFILNKETSTILENNIGMFIGELINEDPTLEICIANAFTTPTNKDIDDWYRAALVSLKVAVSKGVNKYNFVH